MKTGYIFIKDLPCELYNLSLASRVLEHNHVFGVMGDFA